jgi:guanyl-specific ribonuclease Sa
MANFAIAKSVLTSTLLAVAIGCTGLVQAKGPQDARAAQIALAELPVQGRQTYELIRSGGPFPYEKDGTVFGNRERLLPAEKRGTTASTPSRRQDHATGEPGALCVEAPQGAGRLLLHRRPLREFSPDRGVDRP